MAVDIVKGLFVFAGIDGVRFRRPVVPGDQIVFEVELTANPESRDTSWWGALGRALAQKCETAVPLIRGASRPDIAELKSLCASVVTFGGSPLFHIDGVTPEAERFPVFDFAPAGPTPAPAPPAAPGEPGEPRASPNPPVIEAEVVDLYALSPLDREGIRNSVSKTHRAVIVEEAEPAVGVGAEVIAIINEECFFELDAAPVRVSALNVPIPYNHGLEKAALPNVGDVVAAVRGMFGV